MSAKKNPEDKVRRKGLSLPAPIDAYIEWKRGKDGKYSTTVATTLQEKMEADREYGKYLSNLGKTKQPNRP